MGRVGVMTVSLFDHPLLGGLVGDEEVAHLFSLEAEFQAIELFEVVLARASAKFEVIPKSAVNPITRALDKFSPDLQRLIDASLRDGVIIPELVSQMREHVGSPHNKHIHFGATSQDVIDTSLALRLSRAFDLFDERLGVVARTLGALSINFAGNRVVGRSRMQDALEIEATDRIAVWQEMIGDVRSQMTGVKAKVLRVQLGGVVGTRDLFKGHGAEVAEEMGLLLGLDGSGPVWHSNRSGLAGLASWLSLVTGSLGKIGQDVALMAQSQIKEVTFGASDALSELPDMQNPIAAEIIVALARFNAVQLSGMHHALVHENERSGAAWTLEWMMLPQMVLATAGALKRTDAMLTDIETFGS